MAQKEMKPVLETHNGVLVLRDDLVVGGTKATFLARVLPPAEEYIYATPAYGALQIALAATVGPKATLFTAHRKELHPYTTKAVELGAKVLRIAPGYLNVVQSAAREYAKDSKGAYLIPFGFDTEEAVQAIAERATSVFAEAGHVDEVWCAVGSGTLLKGILKAIKVRGQNTIVHGVCVGKTPGEELFGLEGVVLYDYQHLRSRSFDQNTKVKPPFPSTPNYDAKAWDICMAEKGPGVALFWNVM